MTNLEQYLGLRLFITKEEEPSVITSEDLVAQKLAKVIGFNLNEVFVYVHTLTFYRRKGRSRKKISKLIEDLQLTFSVNQKQRNKESIRFYNNHLIVEETIKTGVLEYCESPFEYTRIFQGWYLDEHDIIKSRLVTYVSKKLTRKDHRKIKITIKFSPTQLTRTANAVTEIDLSLDTEFALNFRGLTHSEINDVYSKILNQRQKTAFDEHSVKQDYKEELLLLPNDIDHVLNDLRALGVTETEVNTLREMLIKVRKEKEYPWEKKQSVWLSNIAKRSLNKKINLDVKAIDQLSLQLF